MRDRIPVMNSIFKCVGFTAMYIMTAFCINITVNQDVISTWNLDKTIDLLEMILHCLVMVAIFYFIFLFGKIELKHNFPSKFFIFPIVFGIILCLFFFFYNRIRFFIHLDNFESNSIISAYMTMVYPLFIYLIYTNSERIPIKRTMQIIVVALIIITTWQSLINKTESLVLMVIMNLAPITFCFSKDYRKIADKIERSYYKKKFKWLCFGYVLITAFMSSAKKYFFGVENKEHYPNDGLLIIDRLTVAPVKEVEGPHFIQLSFCAEVMMYIVIGGVFIGLVCHSVRHLYLKKYGIMSLSAALYFIVKIFIGLCYGLIDSSLLYGLYPFQYYDIAIDTIISAVVLYFAVIENTKIDMKLEMLELCSPMNYFRSVGGEVGDSLEELLPFEYRFQLFDPLDFCIDYGDDFRIRFPHVRCDMRYLPERRFDLKKLYSMVYEGKEYILFKMYDFYGTRKLLILSESVPPKNGIATYSMEMDYIIVSNILSEYRNKLINEISIKA